MERYKLIAIVGEAGSGKDSLARALTDALDKAGYKVHEVVSYTTRPMRDYETDGVDYHYTDGVQFAKLIFEGKILEAAVFNDWVYGTCIDDLDPEAINIEVLNPEGIESMSADARINMCIIQCVCDEKTRLIRQLEREEDPNIDEIIRRLGTDRTDFADFILSRYSDWTLILPTGGPASPKEEAEFALEYILRWTEETN